MSHRFIADGTRCAECGLPESDRFHADVTHGTAYVVTRGHVVVGVALTPNGAQHVVHDEAKRLTTADMTATGETRDGVRDAWHRWHALGMKVTTTTLID